MKKLVKLMTICYTAVNKYLGTYKLLQIIRSLNDLFNLILASNPILNNYIHISI